jgi:DNA-binding response OmpR family regulator
MEGFGVMQAESASQCLALAAQHKPSAVVLDHDFLRVDQEDLSEFICQVSPGTVVFLTVDERSTGCTYPTHVRAVAKRGDADLIAFLLHQIG